MKVLRGTIQRVHDLSEETIEQLYSLLLSIFDQKNKPQFIEDLYEKDYVILLFLQEEDRTDDIINDPSDIKGFSTQKVMYVPYQQNTYGIVFSGDTVIEKAYWGTPELSRVWTHLAFALRNREPHLRWFWFLISSGYRTYRYLPIFFQEYYPCLDKTTPESTKQFMHFLGQYRYPSYYDSSTGIVRFPDQAERVKDGISDVTEKELKNKHIRFFVEQNPGYIQGDELVCLTEIHPDNFTPKRIAWTQYTLGDVLRA